MARKLMRPSELATPAFMMCFPFTVSNAEPNNVLMTSTRPYNLKKAFHQWLKLYNKLAEHSLVYLLPHDNQLFQDLPYVANIGSVLPHDDSLVLLANFKSEPRRGEERIGGDLFERMGYWTRRPPHFWEGEADLKYLRNNLYVGGYGIRSDLGAYHWMREQLDMDVVTVRMTDERLYHLDCLLFPVDHERALVATDVLGPLELREIERHVEIIGVPSEFTYDGWTNAVRIGRKLYCDPRKHGLDADPVSRKAFEVMAVKAGFEPDTSTLLTEFDKSGADLSCLVMHLNYRGRE